MSKRFGLFVASLTLALAAVLSGSQADARPRCNIACVIGQACCSNADCNAFCGGPGLGVCPGAESGGGCCVCVG
jgi:hypothetical protein